MEQKRILVVEDDDDVLMGLNIRLRSSGYSVTSVGDAVMAMTVARRDPPDLVLLDLGLPGGDGFMVIERMHNLTSLATVPIIVLTARDPASNRDRAYKEGAWAFFQKPVEEKRLLAAIQKALQQPSVATGQTQEGLLAHQAVN